jgi:hypothetical protein
VSQHPIGQLKISQPLLSDADDQETPVFCAADASGGAITRKSKAAIRTQKTDAGEIRFFINNSWSGGIACLPTEKTKKAIPSPDYSPQQPQPPLE